MGLSKRMGDEKDVGVFLIVVVLITTNESVLLSVFMICLHFVSVSIVTETNRAGSAKV